MFHNTSTIDTSRICFNRHKQRVNIEVKQKIPHCQCLFGTIVSWASKQIQEVSINGMKLFCFRLNN